MATPAQRTNTWILDEWYDQAVAGTTGGYNGAGEGYVWGRNDEGGLGINLSSNSESRSSPTQLPGPWREMSVTGDNNYGIKTDGTLWAWGNNTDGELGQNTTQKFSSPVQIGSDETWRRISNYPGGGMATKTDGSLWMWGKNDEGMIGQNKGEPSVGKYSSPIQIPGTWSDNFEAGGAAISAVKTDGSLWFWGRNSEGVFGLNSPSPPNMRRSSPVQLPGTWSTTKGQGWSSSQTAIYLKDDGTMWVWGRNYRGVAGPGGPNSRSSPVQITSGTTWSQVFIGNDQALAVKTTGELYAWGSNGNGMLAFGPSGDNNQHPSPIQIGTDTDWSKVGGAFGGNVTKSALKQDGTLWAWGEDPYGQLGMGSILPAPSGGYSSPKQVGGTNGTNWAQTIKGEYTNGAAKEL